MIEVTDNMAESARKLMSAGTTVAVGYRILVKTIGAVSELEDFEKEKFKTLASAKFEVKTAEQKEREDNGTQYGIAVSVGRGAFQAPALGGENWIEEGDVVVFDRYAGVLMELPPGSGKKFRLMNDESILAKMETK